MKGFTLIEVLVAMAIFVIGILAIWKMQLTGTKTNVFSYNIIEASNCLTQKIEEMRADFIQSKTLPDVGTAQNVCSVNNRHYYLKTEVTLPNEIPDARLVKVTAGWGGSNCEEAHVENCQHTFSNLDLLTKIYE